MNTVSEQHPLLQPYFVRGDKSNLFTGHQCIKPLWNKFGLISDIVSPNIQAFNNISYTCITSGLHVNVVKRAMIKG